MPKLLSVPIVSNLKKNLEEIKKKYSGASVFEEAEPIGAEGQLGRAVRNLSIYSLLCTKVLEAVSCRYQGMIVYSKLPLLLIFFFSFPFKMLRLKTTAFSSLDDSKTPEA